MWPVYLYWALQILVRTAFIKTTTSLSWQQVCLVFIIIIRENHVYLFYDNLLILNSIGSIQRSIRILRCICTTLVIIHCRDREWDNI